METKVLVVTLYRRPDLTRKLFAALSKCWGIEEYYILISCDRADEHYGACTESIEIAQSFIETRGPGCVSELFVHDPRLGVDLNKLFVIPQAFEIADFMVFLEDDTPPAQDALRFFEACDRKFRDDKSVISISGYNRYLAPEEHERVLREEPYALDQGGQFTPWGWAMWKDRYESVMGTGEAYKEKWGDEANGRFDWWICDVMKSMPGARTIYPVMPRTNHTGADRAEHTPSSQYLMENEFSPFGAWTQPMPDPDPALWTLK